jgi:hypothetical protein
MNEVESEPHGGISFHKHAGALKQVCKGAKLDNFKHLPVFMLLASRNVHSRALFVATDPATKYPVLVYVSTLYCEIHSFCMHVCLFPQDELGQQMALFTRKS